jgi:CRP/FNR family transcriptional regulator, anaerobic regulatory protein
MIHTMEMLEVVDAYPALRDLPASLRDAIAAESRRISAPAGTVLFDEGKPCAGHLLVLEGTLRIYRSGDGGREIGLYRVERGEFCLFSALGLLGSGRCPARASAEGALEAVLVPASLFHRMIDESPVFRASVFRLLGEGVSNVLSRFEDVALRRMDQRLAVSLLRRGVSIPATHRELADEVGTTREAVSRLLEAFASRGIVRLGRRHVEVLDPAALREIAQETGGSGWPDER